MNFREYTCKSSSSIEELIPPVLRSEHRCIPFYGDELELNKGYEEYDPSQHTLENYSNKGYEEWVTPLRLTKDDILKTIEFLKDKYKKNRNYASFFKIKYGQHQKIRKQYTFRDKLYYYKTEFNESKNKRWNKPMNVKWPETNTKIVSLLDCDLESTLKYDEYDVAWCFRVCRMRGEYLPLFCIPNIYYVCREAALYIYDPAEIHSPAPINLCRWSKPYYD